MPRRIFGPEDAPATGPPPGPTAEELLQQALGLQEARAQQAREAESRALMQLQEAQAAPAPGINPLAAALSMGLGRVGTTLAQAGPGPHPDYAGKTLGLLHEQQTTGQAERKTNLEALRKTYEQAAKEAAAAGDTAAEIKTRTAIHKLDKEAAKQAAADKVKADKEAAADKAARDREAADVKFGRDKELIGLRAKEARTTKASGSGAAILPQDIPTLARGLETNQIQMPQVPKESRVPALKYMQEHKMVILSQKGREAMNKLNSMKAALDQIRDLSAQVNTKDGWARIQHGVQGTVGAFRQQTKEDLAVKNLIDARKQYLSLFARGFGEVGNLAEQEQMRQLEGLPDQFTSKLGAKQSLDRAYEIIATLQKKARATYTESPETLLQDAESQDRVRESLHNDDPLGLED